ncbi:transposase [mine drainage metagenome]|uniref:Transposase n=1 Tax=mine drainage metagenome TaxID=410659 RepID=T1AM62_9ZZZZ
MATKIRLKKGERKFLKEFVSKGVKSAREISRANILLLADKGQDTKEISKAVNITRQKVWRIKKRYLEEGLNSALEDKPRPGQPIKYNKKMRAEIIAKACTAAPVGRKRWSVRLLAEELVKRKGFETINRESIRLILKKAGRSLG